MELVEPPMSNAQSQPDARDMLYRMLRIGRLHYKFFIIVFLLVAIIGAGITMVLPRSYQSIATVVVSNGIMDPLTTQNANASAQALSDDELATQAELIRSRDVAAAVLHQLPPEPKVEGGVKPWLCHHGVNFFCPTPPKEPVDPAMQFSHQIDGLLAGVDVEPELHSRVLTITVKNSDAERAAMIANAFVTNYQNISLTQQRADLSKTLAWLDERTASLRSRWVEAETNASHFNGSHNLSNNGANTPLIDKQIADAATNLSQAQGRYAAAQAKADALQEALKTGNERELVSLSQQPLLVATANSLLQLQNERMQQAATFGPNHPTVQALDRQIASTRASMASETRGALSQIHNDVVSAQAEVNQIQHNLDSLRGQSASQSGPQAEYATLAQEAQSARGVYDSFLERTKELAGRVQLLQPPVVFVSHATAASAPTFPNRKKLLIGVFVLASVCGVGAALLKDMMSPGFGDLGDIRRMTALPILATLPDMSRERPRSILRYVMDNPFSTIGEAVRGISAQLALSTGMETHKSQVIALTSAAPHDGKSTLAVWLASVVRAGSRPVLVIDADHRRRRQNLSSAGFTEVLADRIAPQDAIINNPITGIDFMGPGAPKAHPFDAREIAKLRETLTELSRTYSLIIIDTPPLLSMMDGLVLSSVADQTIFLCRWRSVSRAAVAACIERLRAYKANMAGVVVTYFSEASAHITGPHYTKDEQRLIDHLSDS
ncbi:protein-tyrosine kinase [Kozakia baliensis NRIC 0488]|uniref:Uncharacterized protein n=2 Tax=Kozakia baliensis TaxID=153496 RepID=A0A1D8USI4_9PROT|nr:hypothetical protein A0U89_05085 [Kozakia baliensis]GBR23625.1 protein-tyrosine kinase [Kozakia baliensis NRIC 0488]GEL65056.1 chain-length determining protein [Kozakia baliensis]